jgi:hypothetical protein
MSMAGRYVNDRDKQAGREKIISARRGESPPPNRGDRRVAMMRERQFVPMKHGSGMRWARRAKEGAEEEDDESTL